MGSAWDPSNTLLSPDVTYSYSKYSCVRTMYFAHVTFAYLVVISGAFCLLSRVIPYIRPAHAWSGRLYIIFMVWCTATSLLVHNTGLPAAVLLSFVWVLAGMTIGWILIVVHRDNMEKQAANLLAQTVKATGYVPTDMPRALSEAKDDIAAKKTFVQRFVSLKAAHGIVMFVSWVNMLGRIFASNQSGDFTCYTYPMYKQIDTPEGNYSNETLTLVPTNNPNYNQLPWAKTGLVGWAVALSVGPAIAAALIGAGVSFFGAKRASKRQQALHSTSPSAAAHPSVVQVLSHSRAQDSMGPTAA